ncbi:PspA/IM30 family protein [Acidovorax sp. A1169]|uniref:PspA/IM30 family protein n=1 Tax=Acidovorax sp. A1169 TaxID=3059524 RepID=UPI0027379A61|nr:PspA/IM30 family protein [Acidovorax sp. A1169]MDP4073914.1 PspA/IM30 family protein [Acidovorax sp. A1169]
MASSNFLGRLSNLFTGFLSLFVSGIEKNNPEIAYENSINSMKANYDRLKKAAGAIIRQRDDVTTRLHNAKQKQAQLEANLQQAMDTNQDDLAVSILQMKNDNDQSVTELTAEAETAMAEAEKMKDALLEMKSEIKRVEDERDRNLAKLAGAKAKIQIHSQLEGLSVDAEIRALDNVRGHIANVISEANLGDELRGADLDVRMKGLQKGASRATAEAQLAQLKAARAQGAGAKQM